MDIDINARVVKINLELIEFVTREISSYLQTKYMKFLYRDQFIHFHNKI